MARSRSKLSRVWPVVNCRMLRIAVEICSSRSAIVGCTSEHFEEVVGDSLCETGLHGTPHGGLRLQSRGVLNDVLYTDEIEYREGSVGLDIDQYIEVTVRTIVTSRARAEDGKFAHTLGLDGSRVLLYRCDDLFARHVVTGSSRSQSSSYSAASLWPSRALSLWISSSAASDITVPGG